jgi:hypothetical protein
VSKWPAWVQELVWVILKWIMERWAPVGAERTVLGDGGGAVGGCESEG